MSEPWAASKVAFVLQPQDDLDEQTRTDVTVIDGVIGRCTVQTTTALERSALPGYSDFQTAQLSQIVSSMKWTHDSIRQLLRREIHPSSVDALAVARVQLESLYAVCYMLEKPSAVTDYIKAAWKKTYSRFLLEQIECKNLPRFKEFSTSGAYQITQLQTLSQVTEEERATIESDEIGTSLPAGMKRSDLTRFPTPAAVIKKISNPNRKAMLLRLYPEYQHLSSSVHGSPMVTLLKTAFDKHAPHRDQVTDQQRSALFDKEVASLSVSMSLLSIVQCCTEFAPFFPENVDLNGTLADSWGNLIAHSLLGTIIWKLRSKALLRVI